MSRHGCRFPPHPYQVIAWVVTLYSLTVSIVVVVWLLPSSIQPYYSALFSISATVTLLFAGLTTFSDPTDPVVYEHRDAIRHG